MEVDTISYNAWVAKHRLNLENVQLLRKQGALVPYFVDFPELNIYAYTPLPMSIPEDFVKRFGFRKLESPISLQEIKKHLEAVQEAYRIDKGDIVNIKPLRETPLRVLDKENEVLLLQIPLRVTQKYLVVHSQEALKTDSPKSFFDFKVERPSNRMYIDARGLADDYAQILLSLTKVKVLYPRREVVMFFVESDVVREFIDDFHISFIEGDPFSYFSNSPLKDNILVYDMIVSDDDSFCKYGVTISFKSPLNKRLHSLASPPRRFITNYSLHLAQDYDKLDFYKIYGKLPKQHREARAFLERFARILKE